MRPRVRLREEERMSRRTVADALEVVREERRDEQVASGRFDIAVIELPSKERTALVDVVFPELGCRGFVAHVGSVQRPTTDKTGTPRVRHLSSPGRFGNLRRVRHAFGRNPPARG